MRFDRVARTSSSLNLHGISELSSTASCRWRRTSLSSVEPVTTTSTCSPLTVRSCHQGACPGVHFMSYAFYSNLVVKLVVDFLLVIVELFSLGAFVSSQFTHLTDGQTDGRTALRSPIPRAYNAARGKTTYEYNVWEIGVNECVLQRDLELVKCWWHLTFDLRSYFLIF